MLVEVAALRDVNVPVRGRELRQDGLFRVNHAQIGSESQAPISTPMGTK